MNKFFTDLRKRCHVPWGWPAFGYPLCDGIFVYLMLSKASEVEEISTSPRIDESIPTNACVTGLAGMWVCRTIADSSKARY